LVLSCYARVATREAYLTSPFFPLASPFDLLLSLGHLDARLDIGQLRQEKIGLENALEAESESHVNRLSRELSALRLAQQQLQAQVGASTSMLAQASTSRSASTSSTSIGVGVQTPSSTEPSSVGSTGVFSLSPETETRTGIHAYAGRVHAPPEPSAEVMLEAMRRENEELRRRLVDTEREFVRITRLNDIYREELIEHRRRVRRAHVTKSSLLLTNLFVDG